jgi:hypothetical protein
MTRIREGLGDIVASRLTANDVIELARRLIRGDHMMANGVIIPACAPATMNLELGLLSELLKLAGPMKGVKLTRNSVAEARPALRLLRLVGRSKGAERQGKETAGVAWRGDECARRGIQKLTGCLQHVRHIQNLNERHDAIDHVWRLQLLALIGTKAALNIPTIRCAVSLRASDARPVLF